MLGNFDTRIYTVVLTVLAFKGSEELRKHIAIILGLSHNLKVVTILRSKHHVLARNHKLILI